MRLVDITVYSQYFRFVIEDNEEPRESGRYRDPCFSVIYDNERINATCNCDTGSQCRHTAFVHEVINKESDQSLKGILVSARTASAQTITSETVNRIRGAFAREYNLVNNIIDTRQDTRQRRGPLGWEGRLRSGRPMRVVQRTPASFMVYEIGSDEWSLVVGIENPQCQDQKCNDLRVSCFHEEAVEEAIREWRRGGMMEPARGGMVSNDQLNMVVDRRYFDAAMMNASRVLGDSIRSQLRNALMGVDVGSKEDETAYYTNAGNADVKITLPNLTTSAAPGTEAKLSPDIDKAIKALDEPKRKKPPKPRSRFTEIDL